MFWGFFFLSSLTPKGISEQTAARPVLHSWKRAMGSVNSILGKKVLTTNRACQSLSGHKQTPELHGDDLKTHHVQELYKIKGV